MPISGVEACAALPFATMCAPFSVRVIVELHFRSVCSFDKLCKFVVITEHVGFCLIRHGVDNSTGLEGNDFLADLAGYGKAEQAFSQWHTP